jgi:transcriptional regulator with XRE-family HTH domain
VARKATKTPLGDNKAFGRRLREARKRRGLSQAKLAAAVGITQTLVSDYEVGRLRLHAGLLARFAQALRVTSDELLGLKEAKEDGFPRDRRFIRRFQEIAMLSRSEKQTLLKTIDHYLRGAQADRRA